LKEVLKDDHLYISLDKLSDLLTRQGQSLILFQESHTTDSENEKLFIEGFIRSNISLFFWQKAFTDDPITIGIRRDRNLPYEI
jgi:hypothetical protein